MKTIKIIIRGITIILYPIIIIMGIICLSLMLITILIVDTIENKFEERYQENIEDFKDAMKSLFTSYKTLLKFK